MNERKEGERKKLKEKKLQITFNVKLIIGGNEEGKEEKYILAISFLFCLMSFFFERKEHLILYQVQLETFGYQFRYFTEIFFHS